MTIQSITEQQLQQSDFIAVRDNGDELLLSFDASDEQEPYSVCISSLSAWPVQMFFTSAKEAKNIISEKGWGNYTFTPLVRVQA